jgi:hypothetical protein
MREADASLYSVHGVFESDQTASSATLSGFTIDVKTLFAPAV